MTNIANLLTEHMAIWTAAETEKKSGRGRASGNACSVYGVKKLRELILELAVRGKLVPQDSNDEPASELLNRIQAEKSKLIAEGKLKKEKPLAPISEDEKPFELPKGWCWVSIKEVTLLITDGTHHTPTYIDTGIPFISVKDINGITISFEDCKYISQKEHEEINARCNPEINDILLCRIGTLGRPTIVDTNMPFSLFVSVGLLKTSKKVEIQNYLQMALSSPLLYRQYDQIKAGGSHTNKLNLSDIPKLLISLPPITEQHRIVAKVDELMTLCDQLEQQHSNAQEAHETLVTQLLGTLTQSQNAAEFNTNWQRIYAHFDVLFTTEASIDALKQTLLQLAVMGKLVPQDPNDEPASELLKRIQAEKTKLIAEGKLKKEKPLAPISEDEKPFELPKGWEFARLSYVTNLENGDRGKNYPNKDTLVQEGIPFVNAGHLENGFVNKSEMTFITEERYNLLSGGKFTEDDILFCLRGSLGKCAVVKGIAKGAIASSLVIIRVNSNVHLNFFYNYLVSNLLMRSVRKYDNGTAQPNLSSTDLAKFVLPIAPITEQHRIVAKVETLLALCDQLKTLIQQANQQQKAFADALVAQAAL